VSFAHVFDISLRRLRPREELNRVLVCVPSPDAPLLSGPAALSRLEARLQRWPGASALVDTTLLRMIASDCWLGARSGSGAGAAAAAASEVSHVYSTRRARETAEKRGDSSRRTRFR
jgi:hypothetical protein